MHVRPRRRSGTELGQYQRRMTGKPLDHADVPEQFDGTQALRPTGAHIGNSAACWTECSFLDYSVEARKIISLCRPSAALPRHLG
jgi:hypothetical protein